MAGANSPAPAEGSAPTRPPPRSARPGRWSSRPSRSWRWVLVPCLRSFGLAGERVNAGDERLVGRRQVGSRLDCGKWHLHPLGIEKLAHDRLGVGRTGLDVGGAVLPEQ